MNKPALLTMTSNLSKQLQLPVIESESEWPCNTVDTHVETMPINIDRFGKLQNCSHDLNRLNINMKLPAA